MLSFVLDVTVNCFIAMFDRLRTVEFQFDTGRRLIPAPDVPLDQLFRPFSEEVFAAVTDKQIAVIGGENGLGKTEAFLRCRFPQADIPLNLGGIAQIFEEKNLRYERVDMQHGTYETDTEKLLGSSVQGVFVDEGMVFMDERFSPKVLQQLYQEGKMLVIVGGGNLNANKQSTMVTDRLQKQGFSNEIKQFSFPPYLLNNKQSRDLYRIFYPNLSDDQISHVVDSLTEKKIPKTFRTVTSAPNIPSMVSRESLQNQIHHIHEISLLRKFSEGLLR